MAARQTWRWVSLIIGIIIVVVVVLAFLFIYSGVYNVAATYPDRAPVAWAIGTAADNSIKRQARGIKVPKLNDQARIQSGARDYQEDCVVCHGAPGVQIGEIGRGLNPAPPELIDAAEDFKPNELFWITKNGIRMTGMPAWSKTSSDDEIWDIVAFMEKLPSMKPAEYRKLTHGAPTPEQ
ncbi:MAG: cytochrome c [Armatimonadota bacterium]